MARAKPKPTRSIADEIKSGDRRRALEAMRDALADHMVAAESNVVAQVAGRLQAVLSELASLPEVTVMSRTDELRARREGRRASA